MTLKMVEAVRDCLQVLRFLQELPAEEGWITEKHKNVIADLVDETLEEILAPRLRRAEANKVG